MHILIYRVGDAVWIEKDVCVFEKSRDPRPITVSTIEPEACRIRRDRVTAADAVKWVGNHASPTIWGVACSS